MSSSEAPVFEVRACVPGDASAWDEFIDAHPGASAYHRWAWRAVFTRVFGHETVYLGGWREGALVAVLPLVVLDTWLFGRFAVSLPFVNYGGALTTSQADLDALVDHVASLARDQRWKHVELRHLERRCPSLHPKHHKVGMYLALPGDEKSLWDQLDRKVRNLVRKAEKSGLTAVRGGAELVDEFYGVFARNMRDLGTPVYSMQFFREVMAAAGSGGRIHVVRAGPTPVAASLTIAWRDATEVPWASSLREYRAQNPNMWLYWDMLRAAMDDRRATFDFGRSTPDEGTFQFKRQWGAEPRPLCWEYWLPPGQHLPDQSPKNPKFARAIALWQQLPVPVANAVGPFIVRGIA